MVKFVLASLKISATGHGEDSYSYRYFEMFLETIKGFPLISTTLDGFYQRYPTVPQQTIITLFGYLEPMVSHLIEQTGSAPFSGEAITPKAPTPNPNRRKKAKGKPKDQWGSWANARAAAHLAGGVFQAQTPPNFLDTDREADYLAEINRLQARLNISDAQHAFIFHAARICCTATWLFGISSSFPLLRPAWLEQRLQWHRVSRNGPRQAIHAGHARCNNTCGHGGQPQGGGFGGLCSSPPFCSLFLLA